MPLFECSKCHTVENTALSSFWWRAMAQNKPALCSECDPEIGGWHGRFERIPYADYVAKYGKDAVQFPLDEGTAKPQ